MAAALRCRRLSGAPMKIETLLLAPLLALLITGCAQTVASPTPIPRPDTSVEPVWLADLPGAPWPDTCEGFVNLSFDDGPTAMTRDILSVLAHYEVRASFFTLGTAEDLNARLVSEILTAGHQVGNHTYSHKDLTTLDEGEVIEEMEGWTATHRDLGHDDPTLFRPPFGATSPEIRAAAEANGMTEVLWTVDSKDFEATSSEQVIERSLGMEDGGILLLHDGKEPTLEALPELIRHYHSQGLCFGSVAVVDEELPTDTAITHRARAVSE